MSGAPSVHKPLNYSKWDNIEDSSASSDDCHPNIDLASWKRMKKRTRAEKGTLKHLDIRDKWNTTSISKTQGTDDMPLTESGIDWMKANEDKVNKFARIENEREAIDFMVNEPRLADHVVEGYLITKAIDEAVELGPDADVPFKLTDELELLLERCLLIHNCVLACKSANIKAEISVKMFAKRLEDERAYKEYAKEKDKQLTELRQRVLNRRVERIKEAELLAQQELTNTPEDEEIPLGPGGLHPSDVIATLDPTLADAFVSRSMEALEQALKDMPTEDADYYLDRCIRAGLWNAEDGDSATQGRNQRLKQYRESGKEIAAEIAVNKKLEDLRKQGKLYGQENHAQTLPMEEEDEKSASAEVAKPQNPVSTLNELD